MEAKALTLEQTIATIIEELQQLSKEEWYILALEESNTKNLAHVDAKTQEHLFRELLRDAETSISEAEQEEFFDTVMIHYAHLFEFSKDESLVFKNVIQIQCKEMDQSVLEVAQIFSPLLTYLVERVIKELMQCSSSEDVVWNTSIIAVQEQESKRIRFCTKYDKKTEGSTAKFPFHCNKFLNHKIWRDNINYMSSIKLKCSMLQDTLHSLQELEDQGFTLIPDRTNVTDLQIKSKDFRQYISDLIALLDRLEQNHLAIDLARSQFLNEFREDKQGPSQTQDQKTPLESSMLTSDTEQGIVDVPDTGFGKENQMSNSPRIVSELVRILRDSQGKICYMWIRNMLKLILRDLENVNTRVNDAQTSVKRDEANDSTFMSLRNKQFRLPMTILVRSNKDYMQIEPILLVDIIQLSLDNTTEVTILATVDVHNKVCGLAQVPKEAFENFELRQIMTFIWHSIQFNSTDIVEELFLFLSRDLDIFTMDAVQYDLNCELLVESKIFHALQREISLIVSNSRLGDFKKLIHKKQKILDKQHKLEKLCFT
ncbi:MAG: hypothetical protein GY861_15125 [bacterium]|nr:hypothetical protein [bacterium]